MNEYSNIDTKYTFLCMWLTRLNVTHFITERQPSMYDPMKTTERQ